MELIGGLVSLLRAGSDLLILVAAYWLVVELAKRRAPEEGLTTEAVAASELRLALGALIGARLVYVLPAWPMYLRYPLDLVRVQSGLSFYGGVAGALAVGGWLAWRGRLPLARTADLFAPYVAIGIAFDRVGCVVRGDCFGAVAPLPLGVVFPGLTQPRYPAELYEALLALALFALLLLRRERRGFSGELGLAFLVGYPVLRAGVDLFRINLGGWPTADQLASLAVAAAAGSVWAWRSRAGSEQDPTPETSVELGGTAGATGSARVPTSKRASMLRAADARTATDGSADASTRIA